MKSKSNVRTMVLLAILGAWSLVLRFFDFPILPAAPFLKVDFSDLPVLIGMLVNGPAGIVIVAFIRDVLHYVLKGGEVGFPIGAVMSFVASIVMFVPTHFILEKIKRTKHIVRDILMSMTLVIGLVLSMSLINYYVALPIYVTVLNFPIDDYFAYVLAVVIPFNFIKGLFLAAGQLLVIRLVPLYLKGKSAIYPAYQI